jgi:hypothetical protein
MRHVFPIQNADTRLADAQDPKWLGPLLPRVADRGHKASSDRDVL